MKTLATVVLSLVAIVASLTLALSTICAFSGGMYGREGRGPFIVCALVALAVVVVSLRTIAHLNRKLEDN
jgi:uncharacterized membrane protein